MDIVHGINKQLKKIVSMLKEMEGRKFEKYYQFIEALAESKRWKEVLNKIADYAPHQYGYKVDETHELVKKLKMSADELRLCIAFLEDNELITYLPKGGGCGNIGLTKKGFDTSFEIKKIKSEERLKWLTIILSGLAILVSVVLAAVNIYKILNPT